VEVEEDVGVPGGIEECSSVNGRVSHFERCIRFDFGTSIPLYSWRM
jgi:hypothetical protein